MIRLCAVIPNHILYAKNNKKSREKDVSICYMEPFSRFGKQLLRIADALTSGDDAPRIRGPRFGLTSVPHLRCSGRWGDSVPALAGWANLWRASGARWRE